MQFQDTIDTLNAYIKNIHQRNLEVGWWTDLNTGNSILETRNRPEMMLLGISEIVEAWEGLELMDDHLPQYPMPIVEFADAFIRNADLLGGEGFEITTGDILDFENVKATDEIENEDLFGYAIFICRALEGYRKKSDPARLAEYRRNLIFAFLYAKQLGDIEIVQEDADYTFFDVVDAKLEYNANRADHKISNRKAIGGKSI